MFEPIPIVDNPPGDSDPDEPCDDVVVTPPVDDDDGWVWIGTPGDGVWFDSLGDRSYFAVEVNGRRKVLRRMNASAALIRSASDLDVVFFDRYGRDYKTNAANYSSHSSVVTDYMDLGEGVALQRA